jgi:hypothetical protein
MWGCTSPAFGIHTASLKDTGLDKVRRKDALRESDASVSSAWWTLRGAF